MGKQHTKRVVHIVKGITIGMVYGVSWLMLSVTSIDDKSLVPIGIAGVIIVFTGGLIWKISGWKSDTENKLHEITIRLEEITKNMIRISDSIAQIQIDLNVAKTKLPPEPLKIVTNDVLK